MSLILYIVSCFGKVVLLSGDKNVFISLFLLHRVSSSTSTCNIVADVAESKLSIILLGKFWDISLFREEGKMMFGKSLSLTCVQRLVMPGGRGRGGSWSPCGTPRPTHMAGDLASESPQQNPDRCPVRVRAGSVLRPEGSQNEKHYGTSFLCNMLRIF